MARHDIVIIKETHRGLLYEDGVLRDLLPAGRYNIPREPSRFATFFGVKSPRVEVLLVDVRSRDRTVLVPDLFTADGATISASFAVQYRVADPVAATHRVKNFEDRLLSEVQAIARRVLRGLSVEEILGSRDEVGEEILLQIRESLATAGLEVLALDFKDLIVPEELRKIMNQAVAARKLRLAGLTETETAEEDESAVANDPEVEDEDRLIIAGARFARDVEADPVLDELSVGGFDRALLRCHS